MPVEHAPAWGDGRPQVDARLPYASRERVERDRDRLVGKREWTERGSLIPAAPPPRGPGGPPPLKRRPYFYGEVAPSFSNGGVRCPEMGPYRGGLGSEAGAGHRKFERDAFYGDPPSSGGFAMAMPGEFRRKELEDRKQGYSRKSSFGGPEGPLNPDPSRAYSSQRAGDLDMVWEQERSGQRGGRDGWEPGARGDRDFQRWRRQALDRYRWQGNVATGPHGPMGGLGSGPSTDVRKWASVDRDRELRLDRYLRDDARTGPRAELHAVREAVVSPSRIRDRQASTSASRSWREGTSASVPVEGPSRASSPITKQESSNVESTKQATAKEASEVSSASSASSKEHPLPPSPGTSEGNHVSLGKGPSSPPRKPRLGWGQGLVAFERKAVVEDEVMEKGQPTEELVEMPEALSVNKEAAKSLVDVVPGSCTQGLPVSVNSLSDAAPSAVQEVVASEECAPEAPVDAKSANFPEQASAQASPSKLLLDSAPSSHTSGPTSTDSAQVQVSGTPDLFFSSPISPRPLAHPFVPVNNSSAVMGVPRIASPPSVAVSDPGLTQSIPAPLPSSPMEEEVPCKELLTGPDSKEQVPCTPVPQIDEGPDTLEAGLPCSVADELEQPEERLSIPTTSRQESQVLDLGNDKTEGDTGSAQIVMGCSPVVAVGKDAILQEMEHVDMEIERLERELASLGGWETICAEDLDSDSKPTGRTMVSDPCSGTELNQVARLSQSGDDNVCVTQATPPVLIITDQPGASPQVEEVSVQNIQSPSADSGLARQGACLEKGAVGVTEEQVRVRLFSRLVLEERRAFVAARLEENKQKAHHAHEALSHLLPMGSHLDDEPLYQRPEDAPCWEKNLQMHALMERHVKEVVAEQLREQQFAERVLALKYRALREVWKHEQAGGVRKDRFGREKGGKLVSMERRNGAFLTASRTSLRLKPIVPGRFGDEEVQVIKKLLADGAGAELRTNLRMPPMILLDKEREVRRFVSHNGLIVNPVEAVEEQKLINPWTESEKKVFLEKFLVYNKNFRRIASFLEHKTTWDCVRFYYLSQKTEDFEKIRRRQQLKKRRDYRVSNAFMGVTAVAVTTSRREANAATLPAFAVGKEGAKATRRARADSVQELTTMSGRGGLKDREIARRDRDGESLEAKVEEDTVEADDGVGVEGDTRQETSAQHPQGSEQKSAPLVVALGGVKGNRTGSKRERDKDQGGKGSLDLGQSDTKKLRSSSSRREGKAAGSDDAEVHWLDSERKLFVEALVMHGKDFRSVAAAVGSKTAGQCKAYFSKSRKRLGLDRLLDPSIRHSNLLSEGVKVESQENFAPHTFVDAMGSSHQVTAGASFSRGGQDGDMLEAANLLLSQTQGRLGRGGGDSKECAPKGLGPQGTSLSEPPGTTAPHQVSFTMTRHLEGDLESEKLEGLPHPSVAENASFAEEVLKAAAVLARESFSSPGPEHGGADSAAERGRHSAGESSAEPGRVLAMPPEAARARDSEGLARGGSEIDEGAVVALVGLAAVAQKESKKLRKEGSVEGLAANSGGKASRAGGEKKERTVAVWSQAEKDLFADIVSTEGRNWKRLQEVFPTKTLTQLRTHYQNSKAKRLLAEKREALAKEGTQDSSGGAEAKKGPSGAGKKGAGEEGKGKASEGRRGPTSSGLEEAKGMLAPDSTDSAASRKRKAEDDLASETRPLPSFGHPFTPFLQPPTLGEKGPSPAPSAGFAGALAAVPSLLPGVSSLGLEERQQLVMQQLMSLMYAQNMGAYGAPTGASLGAAAASLYSPMFAPQFGMFGAPMGLPPAALASHLRGLQGMGLPVLQGADSNGGAASNPPELEFLPSSSQPAGQSEVMKVQEAAPFKPRTADVKLFGQSLLRADPVPKHVEEEKSPSSSEEPPTALAEPPKPPRVERDGTAGQQAGLFPGLGLGPWPFMPGWGSSAARGWQFDRDQGPQTKQGDDEAPPQRATSQAPSVQDVVQRAAQALAEAEEEAPGAPAETGPSESAKPNQLGTVKGEADATEDGGIRPAGQGGAASFHSQNSASYARGAAEPLQSLWDAFGRKQSSLAVSQSGHPALSEATQQQAPAEAMAAFYRAAMQPGAMGLGWNNAMGLGNPRLAMAVAMHQQEQQDARNLLQASLYGDELNGRLGSRDSAHDELNRTNQK